MKKLYVFFVLMLALAGCRKGFLEAKPDKALLVPQTLNDFQNILDNYQVFGAAPYLGLLGSDDIYATASGLAAALPLVRNAYVWKADMYPQPSVPDWSIPYQQVFYANVVLDGLDRYAAGATEQAAVRRLRGSALFLRSLAFYHLAQQFARPYAPAYLSAPGIPLRLSSDINRKVGRGTVENTYAQIVSDLLLAEGLMPEKESLNVRPSRVAALALLARVYLSMSDYVKAEDFAGQALALQPALLDYKSLNPAAARPFPQTGSGANPEVLYDIPVIGLSFLTGSQTGVDTLLYKQYENNDLRKRFFFLPGTTGAYTFKGSYTGQGSVFAGLAVDELFLIRVECRARRNELTGALSDLNTLLRARWAAGTFTDRRAATADEALELVLTERRKELVFRNLRWTDLRRLNREARFAETLVRQTAGGMFSLAADDERYVLAIPADEIALSGIEQNPR